MKRAFWSILFCFLTTMVFSQRVYFVYLQTESDQPFFVRMNDKTYSSSASGYVILSKLRDSTYSFKIGFPQNKWPEQQFSIEVKGKDRGLLVKNFGEKGWGLFDLQTLSVQMANVGTRKPVDTSGTVSAFTDVLSKAANDPTLRERPVLVKQEEKMTPMVETAVVKQEVTALEKDKTEGSAKVENAVSQEKDKGETKERVVVDTMTSVKKDESMADRGMQGNDKDLVTKDTAMKGQLVKEKPIEKKEEEKKQVEEPKQPVVEQPVVEQPVLEEKKQEQQVNYSPSKVLKKAESSTSEGFGLTFVDQYVDGKKDTIKIFIPEQKENMVMNAPAKDSPAIGSAVVRKVALRSCTSVATENDFLKLRKRMAALSNDEAMINESKKSFKGKCFMSEQVRNLGALFLKEPGKFQFFEAAYPFVVDGDKFVELMGEFKDPYFVHRFKNLVGN